MRRAIRHTLDNLCSDEKEKVMQMIKQLNELQKRCTDLEQVLERSYRDKDKLIKLKEGMSHQLEETQMKLLQAAKSSRESQQQIEALPLRLENIESERRTLTSYFHSSQLEVQSLRETLREIEL
jgi:chromosome segregation ATPase